MRNTGDDLFSDFDTTPCHHLSCSQCKLTSAHVPAAGADAAGNMRECTASDVSAGTTVPCGEGDNYCPGNSEGGRCKPAKPWSKQECSSNAQVSKHT